MVLIGIGTSPQIVIEHNAKRKFVSFTNTHAAQTIYLSDDADPKTNTAKWAILSGETLIIDRQNGFPERAYYAIANGGGTDLMVGFQNEE